MRARYAKDKAARAILTLSRKVQLGTATDEDARAVPEDWRGWLLPGETEAKGPHGERLFVHFLAEVREVVVGSINNDADDIGSGTRRMAHWQAALADSSCVWTAPHRQTASSERPVRLGTSGSKPEYEAAVDRFASSLENHKRRSREDVKAPWIVPAEAKEAVREALRSVTLMLCSSPKQGLWEEFAGTPQSTDLAVRFGTTIATAIGRFTSTEKSAMPVIAFLTRAMKLGVLDGGGLCSQVACTARSAGSGSPHPPACLCLGQLLQSIAEAPGGPSRHTTRDVRTGAIAAVIAAWQVTSDAVEMPPVPLVVVTMDSATTPDADAVAPTRDRRRDMEGVAALGWLIALHAQRFEQGRLEEGDEEVLLAAAAELDAMSDRPTLAVAATIAAAVTRTAARRWSLGGPRAGRTAALDRAVAQLARSAAGAFRELRQPFLVLATLSPFAETRSVFESSSQALKIYEAGQDVQLAFQRVGLWDQAAASYQKALDQLSWFVDDYYEERLRSEPKQPRNEEERRRLLEGPVVTAKRSEVEEQLHLGRVGGLVQQAESRIRAGRAAESAVYLHEASTALDLLMGALSAIDAQQARVSGRTDLAGYLRYGERWAVMPALMRYRVAVAGVLAAANGDLADDKAPKHARQKAAAARTHALALSQVFTERHTWELHRVEVVAALWNDDIDLAYEVAAVVQAGGDDVVGDYLLPTLRWAEEHAPALRDHVGRQALRNAIESLAAMPTRASPRLPDLVVLRS